MTISFWVSYSSGNFQKTPRDKEHINSVLTDIEGVDKKIGDCMNSFVNLWERIIEHSVKTGIAKAEGRDYYIGLLREIEEKRITLISWGNKIRAGK